uniref:Plant heme peroxidase family profile domain-containing protein n=1 Tax=Oryza punctata TaxID=4537 RepID=A0A0E0MKA6_ORYPU
MAVVHRFLHRGLSGASPLPSFDGLILVSPQELGKRPASSSSSAEAAAVGDVAAELRATREDVKQVRLGWHDAGTYDKNITEWPKCGGANGLLKALFLVILIKSKHAGVTYADIFQLASATAIEEAGGPKIPMIYGRADVAGGEECPPEGRIPVADPPSPAEHLREVFYRMGLSDKELIHLDELDHSVVDGKNGPGAPEGQSWTSEWLKFDNSYFKDIKGRRDEDLLVLPTDAVLFEDSSFKIYAEKYAKDQDAFFEDYAEAHAKLSNLGARFDPPKKFNPLIGKSDLGAVY